MKKVYIITAIIFSFFLHSCEEVIDVDLDTEKPRLVVDAGINWYKGTAGEQQKSNSPQRLVIIATPFLLFLAQRCLLKTASIPFSIL